METDQGATEAQVPPTKEHRAIQGFLVEPSSVESPVHCPVWSVHTCGTGVVYTPLGSPEAPIPMVVCGHVRCQMEPGSLGCTTAATKTYLGIVASYAPLRCH